MAWLVLLGFLRITTNSRVFANPLTPEKTTELVNEWIHQPPVVILSPSDRHWKILKQLLAMSGTASNLTTDAHIAAQAIENGGTLYSTNSDFSRFADFKWKDPLRVR